MKRYLITQTASDKNIDIFLVNGVFIEDKKVRKYALDSVFDIQYEIKVFEEEDVSIFLSKKEDTLLIKSNYQDKDVKDRYIYFMYFLQDVDFKNFSFKNIIDFIKYDSKKIIDDGKPVERTIFEEDHLYEQAEKINRKILKNKINGTIQILEDNTPLINKIVKNILGIGLAILAGILIYKLLK